MAWWRIFRREHDEEVVTPGVSPAEPVQERGTRRSAGADLDRETRERRRSRLERRISNLEYDIAMAESALEADNRWMQRVNEIDRAIAQAREDLGRISTAPPDSAPGITLEPRPVVIKGIEPEMPSNVHFSVGDVHFRYSEEIDWSERGEQRSEVALRSFEGDIPALMPRDLPEDRREALHEHLAHSLAALAVFLRDNALNGEPQPEYTLADLAQPCPECGGWRDFKGRCIACQRREWQAARIRSEIERLIDERNRHLEELSRQRDALPILRRQLEGARAELERYL